MDSPDKSSPYYRPEVRPIYRRTQTFIRTVFRTLFGLRIEGQENVPAEGPFILASNHQSWFDPPVIGACSPREIFYAAKKELFDTFILGPLVKFYNAIPIQRSGFSRSALVKLGEALEVGSGIIIFPEGTRFLDGRLRPPKAGVGMLALRHRVRIVPVYISGSSILRYQTFRRKLRVKFGRSFTLEEIGLADVEGKEGYRAVTEEVMRRIAAVGEVDPPVWK